MTSVTDSGAVRLSIVVLAYEMREQAMRTLAALMPDRQEGVSGERYEVIAVDNGSVRDPLDEAEVRALGPHVHLRRVADASPSPLSAVNAAVASTTGEYVGVILDGACLVTPGVVGAALAAQSLGDSVFATTFAWHLGPDVQQRSMADSYGPAAEADLLRRVGWPADGRGLFREAAIDASNPAGWFGPLSESRFFVMPRVLWDEVGGYDERFVAPGGGLGALDFFRRVTEHAHVRVVGLLGEGSFHQVHGGITTNAGDDRWREFHAEYERIVGSPWVMPDVPITYMGQITGAAREWVGAARVGDEMLREMRARGAALPLQGAKLVDVAAGFHGDGWVAPRAMLTVSVSRPCAVIEVVGWLPGDVQAPARLAVDGVTVAEGPVGPGVFTLRAQADLPPDRATDITVDIASTVPADLQATADDREIAWQVGVIRILPAFAGDS